MMKRTEPKVIELGVEKLQGMLQDLQTTVDEEHYELVKAFVDSYTYLIHALSQKRVAVGRLQKLLFGARTEKTANVVGESMDIPPSSEERPAAESIPAADSQSEPLKPRKGHGRNGADAYHGAEKIQVPHPSLEAGDACPDCQQGTLYQMSRPGVLIRIVGQAPVQAKVYELQKLRCNLCGKIFTAPAPEDVGSEKYDATTGSIIGLLKYGSGMPFNRLDRLQGSTAAVI